jgi:multidrug efflux pump
MMGSKLLRAGDTERGLAGWINRQFERVRRAYGRALASTLAYRPVVLAFWLIVVLLMVPFYLFSQRELAPAEDQGVVFVIVQAAANSTLEQTQLFAERINQVFEAIPETDVTFQITFPTGGFGGMVTRPWSERQRTAAELQIAAAGELSKIPGVRIIPITPPALPGGGDFPVDLAISSTAEPAHIVELSSSPTRWCRRPSRAACSCSPTPTSNSISRRPRSSSTATSSARRASA